MDVYKALRELLDKDATGCPPAPEIDRILRILFTEEEARVALGLGFKPFPVEVIVGRAGVESGAARKHLEALASRCLIFVKEKEGVRRYALLPVMPGLFEFPYMKGHEDETLQELAPLWNAQPLHPFGLEFRQTALGL